MYKTKIDKTARAYFNMYKKYGDLNPSFDTRKIYAVVSSELSASGEAVNTTVLHNEIKDYIKKAEYKKETSDDILFYFFVIGIVLVIYYLIRDKKKV